MNASTPSTAETRDPARRWPRNLATVAAYTALGLSGAAVSVVGGVAAGWLSWLWVSGGWGKVLAVVTLVLMLGVLFAGCRAAGWGMSSRLGAALPALGWTAGSLLLVVGSMRGDQIITSGLHLAYLYGSIIALALATARTER
ncbi:hypothetical protein FHX37_2757 [Haloactinospora alba]|uniref:Uncharacterized protein n=1 Tax=Haloactinospora alba TaxID=405555 RepID=A0A543NLU5_9ACTN|nr:hypothetical protein [Haloactinospora alba]TQN32774.1 hypothetical protein FHX37_2757 [Haloactinospora alba]